MEFLASKRVNPATRFKNRSCTVSYGLNAMTLKLPDVTLVAIDSVTPDLTRESLKDSLDIIDPADVVVFSDSLLLPEGLRVRSSPSSFENVAQILWYEVPKFVKTSHFLLVQWDGWVIDEYSWNDDWLRYDYIGAPWWYKEKNVGNGGFSLRSTNLMRYLTYNKEKFPVAHPEDDVLCRQYRDQLPSFKWAPGFEALRFSFERISPPTSTFGFHGIFNWSKVLNPDQLAYRLSLANDYVKSKVEWGEVVREFA